MCGRAAQTQQAVYAAARGLGFEGCVPQRNSTNSTNNAHASTTTTTANTTSTNTNATTARNDLAAASGSTSTTAAAAAAAVSASSSSTDDKKSKSSQYEYEWKDNFNLSPGMHAMVFYAEEESNNTNSRTTASSSPASAGTANNNNKARKSIRMDRKIWGLVPRGGTKSAPLPLGMNMHFQNLMFNARSDTLYEKQTFSRIAKQGRSCLIAVDGFFEWKSEPVVGSKGKKKQPYFVYRKGVKPGVTSSSEEEQQSSRPFLLMAGLWTRVATGRAEGPALLDTFTILTTEACPCLEWLHSRMPVCVFDDDLARQWLLNPSPSVHRQLDQRARSIGTGASALLDWHAVTTEMSTTKYRSADSIKPLPKFKTVKSFFATAAAAAAASPKKESRPHEKEDSSSGKTLSTPPATKSTSKKRAAITSNVNKQPSSGKKSKTTPSSTPPKKGTIQSFFATKSQTQKK